MITLVAKKRGADKMKEHKRITLLSTAYKVCIGVDRKIKKRDLLILAEKEEELRGLLKRLKKYCGKKGLEVNTGKTNLLKFREEEGEEERKEEEVEVVVEKNGGGKRIEEVKEVTYLKYKFKRNGGQKVHVRERVRKAIRIMQQVWGIEKRRFRGNWKRRMELFGW